jgi:hypothetical protein
MLMAYMKETEINFQSMREKKNDESGHDKREREKRERKTMTERVQYVL